MKRINETFSHFFSFLHGEKGNLRQKIFRGGLWLTALFFCSYFIQFMKGIILARLLDPSIFGIIAICLAVIRGMDLLSETGIKPALIQNKKDFYCSRDTAFCITIIRGFLLSIIAFSIAPLVGLFYDNEILTKIIRAMSISFIIVGFVNINIISLEKELNFKRIAIAEQIASIFNFLIVVSLAYYLRNVWALALGHIAGSFSILIVSYLIIPGFPKINFDLQIAKEIINYGRYITGLTIVIYLTTEIDNFVIGKVIGMESLGYYLIAYTFSNIATSDVAKIIARVMFPAFCKLQQDIDILRIAYLLNLKVLCIFSFCVTVGIIILAEDIILLLYGPKWAPSVQALQVLSVFGLLRAVPGLNGYIYNSIGKPNIPFYINTAKLITIALIIIPLTRSFGIIGTAYCVTLPSIFFYFYSIKIMKKILYFKQIELCKIFIRPTLTCAIMGIIVFLLRKVLLPINIVDLIFLILSGAIMSLLINYKFFKNLFNLYNQKDSAYISIRTP